MKPEPKPIYLLAGGPGSRRNGADPLLQRVFEQAGKPSPSIAYVGAASGDNPGFFKMLTGFFKQSGAGAVTLAALASSRANIDKTTAILEESDLVFITGGDVEAGMALLDQRAMTPVLRRLFDAGKPFFGLSAGSIMLARSWIRWSDPENDHTAEPFDCLNFAPILCDMHSEEDDWVELKALLRLHPDKTIGYGVPSGAGLCITPGGTLTAIGGNIARFQRQVRDIHPLPPLLP